MIFLITAKNLATGRKIVPRKPRKTLLQSLFKVIPHQKVIWYSGLLINNNIILNNGY